MLSLAVLNNAANVYLNRKFIIFYEKKSRGKLRQAVHVTSMIIKICKFTLEVSKKHKYALHKEK